jgi:glycolate oxidase iron-sulfur subunit
MQADLAPQFKGNRQAEKAQDILRACVHCGFCAAACPTYQLTGDELEGPRGRIYLIKQMLQTGEVSLPTQTHLDRCLTCGACEPACPSGVRYRNLLEIGRSMVERRVPRCWRDRLARLFMLRVVCHAKRFAAAVKLGRALGRALPVRIRERLPAATGNMDSRQTNHPRRMLALQGCVQPTAAPQTNAAAARVLDRLGISLVEVREAGCCGAISHHLAASDQAREHARRNIDAWWPQIEAGAEAIVMTASGCGLMVREYAELLQDDAAYADRAARVSAMSKDLAEVLAAENLDAFAGVGQGLRIAFQCPCTLQHGHGLDGVVEGILRRCGYVTTHIPDSQQCCGSAGSYSMLQPEMAERLLERKLTAVMSGQPQLIASANVGCQMYLATRAQLPVKHWIELLNQ